MPYSAKNLIIFGKRTTIRFSAEEWEALRAISLAESMSCDRFCEQALQKFSGDNVSMSAKVKTAIIAYLYEAWCRDEFIIVDAQTI